MKRLSFFLMLTAIAFCLTAFADDTQTQAKQTVVPVPSKNVCMVNNRAFDKDQIPVEVEGKTYYGCCEMCKKALAERKELRVAIDPVSGNEVDKSVAIIGALPDGSTLYFESEDDLKKYNDNDKNQ